MIGLQFCFKILVYLICCMCSKVCVSGVDGGFDSADLFMPQEGKIIIMDATCVLSVVHVCQLFISDCL